MPKTTEKYTSIKQTKEVIISIELPLVFIDSVNFLNDSSGNLLENVGENNCHMKVRNLMLMY